MFSLFYALFLFSVPLSPSLLSLLSFSLVGSSFSSGFSALFGSSEEGDSEDGGREGEDHDGDVVTSDVDVDDDELS